MHRLKKMRLYPKDNARSSYVEQIINMLRVIFIRPKRPWSIWDKMKTTRKQFILLFLPLSPFTLRRHDKNNKKIRPFLREKLDLTYFWRKCDKWCFTSSGRNAWQSCDHVTNGNINCLTSNKTSAFSVWKLSSLKFHFSLCLAPSIIREAVTKSLRRENVVGSTSNNPQKKITQRSM